MPDATKRDQYPILRTKLHRPPVSCDVIRRQRLHDVLDRGLTMPLTVISAPAGYGKSVLASQWVESSGVPCAWLSLDTGDSGLGEFLTYVLGALRTLFPGACTETEALTSALQMPPLEVIGACLINELDALETPFVLALDDYHRIQTSSEVNRFIEFILKYPPRPMRLLLITRRDPPLPLAAMRAAGRLEEVRLQGLRFTTPEIADFLVATADSTVSGEALTNLHEQTEGWVVGLRMVSLALRHVADPDGFLKDLHGGLSHMQEYLFQEVLAGKTPVVRDSLIKSSILNRFCAGLLNAISGDDASPVHNRLGGKEMLGFLQERDLFIIPLDPHHEWFRFHHLFQELLKGQLERHHTPAEIEALHWRASEWFEAEGLIEEALEHAVAAGEVERAAQIIERNRQDALNTDQWYMLEKWMSRLPETVVQQRAELLMVRAWIFLHHFRFESVFPILDQVESLLGTDGDQEPLRGEIALHRGYILYFLGEAAGSLQNTSQALEQIPIPFTEARAQSEVIFALASQMQGQKAQALRGLDDLILSYASPTELRKTRLVITCVFIHLLSGDLVEAVAANRRLREVAERGRFEYATAWTNYLQGLIHLFRCEFDDAIEFLKRSASQRFIHFHRAAADSIIALMLVHQARGHEEAAGEVLELLRDYVGPFDDPVLWTLARSSEARLATMQERREPAVRWLESGPTPDIGAMLWWLEVPSTTRCRALICDGSITSLEEAATGLGESVRIAESHHNTLQLIGVLVLQAFVWEKLGKVDEGLAALKRAVELAEPGGFVFPFLEPGPAVAEMLLRLADQAEHQPFIDRILAAISPHAAPLARSKSTDFMAESLPASRTDRSSSAPDVLVEALTNRELDILELLAQRLQNKEIAGVLHISTHTVNDHLKHIYQKIGVTGRRRAVQRAIEIGILGHRSPG